MQCFFYGKTTVIHGKINFLKKNSRSIFYRQKSRYRNIHKTWKNSDRGKSRPWKVFKIENSLPWKKFNSKNFFTVKLLNRENFFTMEILNRANQSLSILKIEYRENISTVKNSLPWRSILIYTGNWVPRKNLPWKMFNREKLFKILSRENQSVKIFWPWEI